MGRVIKISVNEKLIAKYRDENRGILNELFIYIWTLSLKLNLPDESFNTSCKYI